jgi:hypothetical protein
MSCTSPVLVAQLAAMEAQIALYNAMFTAFLTNTGMQEYELDTGQTQTKVKRADLTQQRLMYNSLLNQYSTLYARVNGCGSTRVRGAW